MLRIIDTHSHIHFPQYDHDRDDVITRARTAGVGMIVVGTNLETSRLAIQVCERYQGDIIGAAIGLHPTYEDDFISDDFKILSKNPCVIAIGECGLDYYRITDPKLHARQKNTFEAHIELSHKSKKPLIIHCRQAFSDLIEILNANSHKLKAGQAGIIHFFSGNADEAQKLLDLGFYLGFGGVITFARDYDEVIKKSPLGRIVVETDAPFVAPELYRGKRNEPSYIIETVKKLATIKGVAFEEAVHATTQNAEVLFKKVDEV
ncbi:MAG: TatD family hydrolase [Patescibacteria group bacterium]